MANSDDALDEHKQIANEEPSANVEGELTMRNQGLSSASKTFNLPISGADTEHHTNIYQESEGETVTGQLSSNKVRKKTRKELGVKYRGEKRDIETLLEYCTEMFNELQKTKRKWGHLTKDVKWSRNAAQSITEMVEQLQYLVSSLSSNNASLNQQLHTLYLSQLEMYKERDELKSEKDELKRQNGYLKNFLTQLKSEKVEWKKEREYLENIQTRLKKGKDELKCGNEYSDNLLAQPQPVDLGFGNEFLNVPERSQPMQTSGGESERYPSRRA